jgi:hypothetical protein
MTAKEKAKDLFNKLNDKIISFEDVRLRGNGFEMTRQCALIAVDEILNTIEYSSQADELSKISYWEEVKREIELL